MTNQTCAVMTMTQGEEGERQPNECGLPIEGSGPCAAVMASGKVCGKDRDAGLSDAVRDGLLGGNPIAGVHNVFHAYQPSEYRHVWDAHSANVADEIDAGHEATPVRETA